LKDHHDACLFACAYLAGNYNIFQPEVKYLIDGGGRFENDNPSVVLIKMLMADEILPPGKYSVD
jgi:hypothetical protein